MAQGALPATRLERRKTCVERISETDGRTSRPLSFLLGQIISVLITGTAVFSSQLAEYRIDIPVTQSSLNYVLLCFHLLWEARRLCREGLAMPAWRYALWAICDVEANFLVVQAYQYTSIPSVMLLDCLAVPVAMLASRAMLGARYTRGHVMACCICVAGLALTITSDVISGNVSASPKGPAWFGDVLVLWGGSLYGFSNVLEEWLLKRSRKRCEALGMLGLWGTLITVIQAGLLERQALLQAVWSAHALLCLFGFQLCLFGMYVLTSAFLLYSDAALFNLSLLTSDLYGVLFSWLVQHGRVTWLYGAAFVTTVSGLALYHTQPVVTALRAEDHDRRAGAHRLLMAGG